MTLSPRHLLPRLAPLLALLAVLALFAALIAPSGRLGSFLSLPNLQVLLHANTIAGVAALGMLLVIVSGGIDLSVGSVVALVTVVTMTAYNAVYVRTGSQLQASLAAVPLGVSAGGLCGLTNGLIIVLGRVRPFVATLGMLSVARGVAIGLAGRQTINFAPGGRPGWVDLLAESESAYFLFSPGFWSLLLLAALAAVLLRWTVLGRHIYAVGGNEQAAWLCGVPVGRTKVIV
ncbi:MAG TPA: ABC transporter permease, partial [Gemmataceae bacterium]|nr:ABC transporter permease [Gemmataceae bacterium]